MMGDDFVLPPFLRQIVIIAVIFVAIIGMKMASPILSLVLLSIFISILLYPLLKWLEKRGLSYNVAMLMVLVGVLPWDWGYWPFW